MCATLSGCFTSPPQIIQLVPNRGAVGVAADAPVTVEFDRAGAEVWQYRNTTRVTRAVRR